MPEQHSTELWKPIDGYPGYEISNQGNLRSSRGFGRVGGNGRVHMLKPQLNRFNGYMQAVFSVNCKKTGQRIHALVARAFIGPILKGMTVNHINGIKTDNRAENLEIVTLSENMLHAFRVLGLRPVPADAIIRDPITGRIKGRRAYKNQGH